MIIAPHQTPLKSLLCLTVSLLLLEPVPAADSDPDPGTPPAFGRDPAAQAESDWVDNRWARTDLGPFLASTLRTPGGSITKAFSVRLGEQAAVVYDTETLSLRAAWTGAFLRPDPARFGLVKAPTIAGQPQFSTPPGPAWSKTPVRMLGYRVHGSATVLQYQVGNVSISESPGWVSDAGGVFLRSLEVDPHDEELRLKLLLTKGHGKLSSLTNPAASAYVRADPAQLEEVTCRGHGHLTLTQDHLELVLPPSTARERSLLALRFGPVKTPHSPSLLAKLEGPDLAGLIQPGPARWLPALETQGRLDRKIGPLAVDTLPLPYANPWNALFFLSGVDFTTDGTAYVSTIHGDVWRVTGIDRSLSKLSWKRFATGLYQALGLQVRDDQVFVLGRDRITRLHDENEDGEADFYENFFDGIDTSGASHQFVTCLEMDDAGNFYYIDPKGLHRVARDGSSKETLAAGFRNPNGLGVSSDGTVITAAPQQGEWTPSSVIVEVQPGGYYGYGGPKVTPSRPLGYDPPLCWLPHSVDNSSGSQAWIPSGAWGPLGGRMIHLLWGRCGMMAVLRDTSSAPAQGAAFVLPAKFLSGPNRASWNARDNSLYVAGSTGWQTSAIKDGALQRVRWTGRKVCWPAAWRADADGMQITFSEPLRRDFAEDAGSYALSWWNYKYAAQYGSNDWSANHPDKVGRDTVEIKSARLSPDGRTVFLQIPAIQPVMQFELKWNLDSDAGKRSTGSLYGTLHHLPPRSAEQ